MKNETQRGSTKISMNFENKTHGTSETNKSLVTVIQNRVSKLNTHGMSKAKKINKNESKVAQKNYR